MEHLDQGTIIYGMNSPKYPDVCCYGLIISASCDIANDKISKLYCLTCVDADEWMLTQVGYDQMYKDKKLQLMKKMSDESQKYGLNAELLMSFSEKQFRTIVEENIDNLKERKSISKVYEQYKKFCVVTASTKGRKTAIYEDKKTAQKYMEQMGKGDLLHYYYLPKIAFDDKKGKSEGLVVDLQEILTIDCKDAKRFISPGIDFLTLADYSKEEQTRLCEYFWLKKDSDFVMIEGKVESPWREHLMQRFSYGFVRIGIDGATNKDYEELICKTVGV